MKRKETVRKICILLALVLCLSAFVSCGSKETAGSSGEETVSLSMSQAAEMANRSSSLWEMMANMFPNYIVYKGVAGGYTFSAVDKDLPLNPYDWSDLSKALRGIDVSAYQGTIDWLKVSASDVDFAFIRVGYRGYGTGKLTLDEKFDYNASSAIKARVPVGVYFVTTAITEEEAVEEAEWVLEQISPYKITWPVVIDVEATGSADGRSNNLNAQARTKIVKAFCDTVKDAGYTPMIYSNIGWFMDQMDLTELTDYDKWFAQYFNQPHFPYAMQVWQAGDDGTVNGIKVNVDINYSMFDYSTGSHMQDVGSGSSANGK